MKKSTVTTIVCAISMFGAFVFSGCATTPPRATFVQEISPGSLLRASDTISTRVEAASDVNITDIEKTRIARGLEEKVAAKKTLNPMTREKINYEIEVTLTRYEKGSAFARAMLAGLGQIHIDGKVNLLEMPSKKKVGEFTIRKTFAWGGGYGASTSIEDIEKIFEDGIAAAVTGQSENNSKSH